MPDPFSWFTRAPRRTHRHSLVGRSELWQMKRAFQLDFLRAQGLTPRHRVLDIGCGSLRGGAALIDFLDAGRYTGVDVRASVLAEARQELKREKLTAKKPAIVLAEGGLDALQFQYAFDVVWAFSVLFHLSDAILETCFTLVRRHLDANDGVFFANVIFGDWEPGEWQGFPVVPRSEERYAALAVRHGMRIERLGLLSDLGHHSGDRSQDGQTMLAFHLDAADSKS